LRSPGTAASTNIALKITDLASGYDLSTNAGTTVTFWMKFFGIKLTSTFSVPVILSINPNVYYGYELSSGYLKLIYNSGPVFIDTLFKGYTGNWIPVSISNFYSGTKSSYFPPMLDSTINRVQMIKDSSFVMPLQGIQFTQLSIGYDCVALFAEFRFYNKYIHQPFGKLLR